MEHEVLAQHQIQEVIRLRDSYIQWRDNLRKTINDQSLNYDGPSISVGQTYTIMCVIINDLTRIIEQK